jgi:hypothetical protein
MAAAKNLSEAKLKAFNLGLSAGKKLSKKEQADLKKKEDDEATAEVFKEFVDTFSDSKAAANRSWVKGSTFQAGAKDAKKKEDENSKLYKPKAYLPVFRKDEEAPEVKVEVKLEPKPIRANKKKDDSKKKSNLELFKEELQAMQEERQQRKELKQTLRQPATSGDEVDDTLDDPCLLPEEILDDPTLSASQGSLSSASALALAAAKAAGGSHD